jgi:hypothetical protein
VRQLLVTADVPISPILVTLMFEAIHSSEASVPSRVTRRHIPEDDILHFNQALFCWYVVVRVDRISVFSLDYIPFCFSNYIH